MDLVHLKNTAVSAALAAGRVIQLHADKEVSVDKKKAGDSYASQVVTEVDKACEAAILDILLPSCTKYDLALLSEETEDDGGRLEKEFFWCIDPMDGTLAFINKHPGYSISIALVAKDGTPYIGVVFDPVTDTLYYAIKGHGAYKNDSPWAIENTNNFLTYVTDRSLKDTPQADHIKRILDRHIEQLHMAEIKEAAGAGSVLNAILVLENGPACMLKLPKKENGGGNIWDFAATACIYEELALPAQNFKGGRLDLNRKDCTFMNHEGIYYTNLYLDEKHFNKSKPGI